MADQSPLNSEGNPQELELELHPTSSPSPIVELPVELLRAIFIASIIPSGNNVQVYTPFALSHVCRAWRTITVNYPDLWAYIHVGPQTKMELFEAMWNRGRRAGVKLKLSLIRNGYEEICRRVADRIKRDTGCLTQLFLSLKKTYFSSVFAGFLGDLEHLQALRMVSPLSETHGGRVSIPVQLTPGLREFELDGIPMPWHCKIFRTGQLTRFTFIGRLTISALDGSPLGTWGDMMAFLRHTPALEKFIYKPLPPVNTSSDTNSAGGTLSHNMVSLPVLNILGVRAHSWGSGMSVFLNSITIRPDMHAEDTAISLACDAINTDLRQIWSTLTRTIFHSRFAPEVLELDRDGGFKAWNRQHRGNHQEYAASFSFTISKGIWDGPRPMLFDEPEFSGSYNAFSFSNIVVLVLRRPLPLGLAVNFSELKTLQVVDFDQVAGPAILRAFRLNDPDVYDYPFPSLHTIIASDPEIGRPLRGPVRSMYGARLRHILEIVDTLKARKMIAPKPNRLEIQWRFGGLPRGEAVGALEDVVCDLVWIHHGKAPKDPDGL